MSLEAFQQAVSEGGIVLAYFWADWEESCQEVTPIMEELGKKYEDKPVVLASLNADDMGFYSVEMNLYPLPIVLIYQDGFEADRLAGVNAPEVYDHVLKTYVEPEEPDPFELITSMGYTM